jgi:hypothetical protein
MDVLVAYLQHLQKELVEGGPRKVQLRVGNFLAAQGYHVSRTTNLRAVLKNFVERQKARCELILKDEDGLLISKEKIIGCGDEFVAQLLLNADLNVRDLRSLFY